MLRGDISEDLFRRLLPERPVLLQLLFVGRRFYQIGRVVHDNHFEEDHVFPFIPELPGSCVHPWRWRLNAYKKAHECNLGLRWVWCHFSQQCDCVLFCFFWGGVRCFKTRDGTWHYYTNIVLVITRWGLQYILLLVVSASEMRMLNVYMCDDFCGFICIFLISFFFFLRYERSRTATLTLQNAFECTWTWSLILVVLLSVQILRLY